MPLDPGASAGDLLVLLHGRGADESDLLPIARAVAPGARVLAPRAPVEHGPGFAWATPDEDVTAGRGLEVAAAEVAALIDAAPPDRLLLLGFSQGAGVAAELLRLRPDGVQATVLLSGFVPQPDRDDPGVAAVRPRVLWGRGAIDPLFRDSVLADTAGWLERHTTLTTRVYPGLGHGVNEEELADVAAFLAG